MAPSVVALHVSAPLTTQGVVAVNGTGTLDVSTVLTVDSHATLSAADVSGYGVISLSDFALFTVSGSVAPAIDFAGTSSALGLLFDHGCDAINAGLLGPLILAMATQGVTAGGSGVVVAAWACATIPFFFSTWEE